MFKIHSSIYILFILFSVVLLTKEQLKSYVMPAFDKWASNCTFTGQCGCYNPYLNYTKNCASYHDDNSSALIQYSGGIGKDLAGGLAGDTWFTCQSQACRVQHLMAPVQLLTAYLHNENEPDHHDFHTNFQLTASRAAKNCSSHHLATMGHQVISFDCHSIAKLICHLCDEIWIRHRYLTSVFGFLRQFNPELPLMSDSDAIDRIYIPHYQPLKDRKIHMLDLLAKMSIRYHFVLDFDRESLSDYSLNLMFNAQLQLAAQFTRGEISLFIKHYAVYAHMVRNNVQLSLILEDDVSLEPQVANLNNFMAQSLRQLIRSTDFDMIFLGGCCDIHCVPAQPASFDSPQLCRGTSRCTHAYLVRLSGAKKMLRNLPMRFPIDHHINHVKDLNNYLLEPPIFVQYQNLSRGGIH